MSFKLVDKIKKSNLPGPMKKVFEAYVSFGNSDGTNIRPTADAVGDRITGSRTTVARYTPRLVRLGLLVHDRNEDGSFKTHSYNSEGTWAYVYHANLIPLSRPEITKAFDIQRQILSEKRQAAGRKGGRPKRQMELFDESNLLQTTESNLLQTGQTNLQQTEQSKLQHGPDSSTTQPKDYPSAVSTAVKSQSVFSASQSEKTPPASPSSSLPENLEIKTSQVSGDVANQEQGQEPMTPEEKAVVDNLGCDDVIPKLLGMPYFYAEHEPEMLRIVRVLMAHNRSIHWLVDVVKWVKSGKGREPNFWRSRLHTGTRAVKQLANHLETGALSEQFNAHIAADGGDVEQLEGYMLRVYKQPESEQRPARAEQIMIHGKVIGWVEPCGNCGYPHDGSEGKAFHEEYCMKIIAAAKATEDHAEDDPRDFEEEGDPDDVDCDADLQHTQKMLATKAE